MSDATFPHGLATAGPAVQVRLSESLAAWLLTAPSIIAFVLMLLIPTLAVVAIAFSDYELGASSLRFVGLANFAELMEDRGFLTSFRNTAFFVAVTTPASVIGGLMLALLIESGTRGRTFFRAVFFLPVVSLMVAMATAFQYMFHPTIGPVNAALRTLGIVGPNWLGSSDSVMWTLAVIGVWEQIGFNMVLFLAGLTAIPRDLYAAAEVDGVRSAWSRFWTVTWPLLGPTSLFVLTITMIRSLRVFDIVATLTQGGPNKASEVLLYTMYTEGFTFFRMGYSAAITVVFLIAVVILMLLQTRVLDRRVHYG
ncbi:sugar ABC transporter permease [Phreatobacter aquaticus]|uniref:Sugar ABC transporter permease n=1 Tax=Phreatobacter aquaticus TaxID=2570229 RepID=A0A4D7QKL5_9HYPH|nr:sugar ABC transporter permease [Phreatobacter aquaticus]QCK85914.1 sugar ABC transporter permease [Phreatobacter aquaticus]